MATIRDLMDERNLTLMQLAVRARISVSTLQRIMDGKSAPWPKTKEDIADALGVTVEDIVWMKERSVQSLRRSKRDE